ncbi:hypothetical protein C8J57DRAFT_1215800 [Mycena rebaudengoi]|nr:hypothetical protein C8J57DRAFT_1215800 [Mycena rebaudengoi]
MKTDEFKKKSSSVTTPAQIKEWLASQLTLKSHDRVCERVPAKLKCTLCVRDKKVCSLQTEFLWAKLRKHFSDRVEFDAVRQASKKKVTTKAKDKESEGDLHDSPPPAASLPWPSTPDMALQGRMDIDPPTPTQVEVGVGTAEDHVNQTRIYVDTMVQTSPLRCCDTEVQTPHVDALNLCLSWALNSPPDNTNALVAQAAVAMAHKTNFAIMRSVLELESHIRGGSSPSNLSHCCKELKVITANFLGELDSCTQTVHGLFRTQDVLESGSGACSASMDVN